MCVEDVALTVGCCAVVRSWGLQQFDGNERSGPRSYPVQRVALPVGGAPPGKAPRSSTVVGPAWTKPQLFLFHTYSWSWFTGVPSSPPSFCLFFWLSCFFGNGDGFFGWINLSSINPLCTFRFDWHLCCWLWLLFKSDQAATPSSHCERYIFPFCSGTINKALIQ